MTATVTAITGVPTRVCDCCEAGTYVRNLETQQFPYGEGGAQQMLSATVPVWRCSGCDDAFTDYEAEEARHEAVCAHLNRLTPAQIAATRRRHSMNQEEWAKHVHIGVASIKRWESGSLIQGASSDAYLRLLDDGIGYARHVAIQRAQKTTTPPIFKQHFTSAEREEARTFQLRVGQR